MSRRTIFPDDAARVRESDPPTSHRAADSNDTAASRTWVMFNLIEHGPQAQFELERLAAGLWSPSRVRTAVHELVERGLVESMGIYRLTPSGRQALIWQIV